MATAAQAQADRDVEKLAISEPVTPRTSILTDADLDKFTLARRPWRRQITPFRDILAGKYAGEGTPEKPYLVEWLPDDVENPLRYPNKWTLTSFVSISTLAVSLASSAYSGAIESLTKQFHASNEVLVLGVSMFVLGFALGPLIWAPLSETLGRRPLFIGTYIMFTLWNAVACASPNIGALIVFRFFAGSFGSSPLTNAGGAIADIFDARLRGLALAVFASAPFLGPALGPITGGFIGITGGWRWVQAFLGFFSGAITLVGVLGLPETYAPILLRNRAQALSKATGKHYLAKLDVGRDIRVIAQFKVALSRPWVLLIKEPIVLVTALYIAIVYGILYCFFAAFPIVFQQGRGWNAGVGGLAFLGIVVGMVFAVSYIIFYDNPRFVRLTEQYGGFVPPEHRLPPGMVGAPLLVIGLAWFAATNGPSVHFMASISAGAPFGAGMVLVFLSIQNYLVDSYTVYAASVLAANSVVRSLFGAAFPLFTRYMYQNLGIHWASALPGFLCLACMPFPFLFYKYGGAIRAKCRYAAEAQKILEQMLQRSAAPAPAPPPPPAAVSAAQDDDLEKEVVSEQSHHDATGSSDHDEIRTAPHGGGLSTAAASTAHGHVVEKVETG